MVPGISAIHGFFAKSLRISRKTAFGIDAWFQGARCRGFALGELELALKIGEY